MNLSKLVMLAACSFLFACGSDGSRPGDETDDGGSSTLDAGFTECGDFTCQPGQHCDNWVCIDGCLSNVNCTADAACQDIDQGSKLGTCNAAEPEPEPEPDPEKDCATFCEKATACGAPDGCQQIATPRAASA